jgi:hypothetical protein
VCTTVTGFLGGSLVSASVRAMGQPIEIGRRQTTDRPTIPAPIKRAVRQRCGFGCVVCGLPIYDYEHMAEWASTHHHVADEITLLCPTHHAEKTRKLLPVERVRAANAAPFNLQSGASTPWTLHFAGSRCEAIIGGNEFSAAIIDGDQVLVPLMIDGEPLVLFRVEDGHLLFSLSVYDERNEPVLLIEDNELVLLVGAAWDFEFVSSRLLIRNAPRAILIDIAFEPPERVVVHRGSFMRNGVCVIVESNGFSVPNVGAHFRNCSMRGASAGIILGAEDHGLAAAYQHSAPPRASEAVLRQWSRGS